MRPTSVLWMAAVLAAGCAPTAPSPDRTAPEPPPASASSAPAAADPAAADLEALYWQRQREARADFTPADAAFMAGMIGHHAQALIMSRMAPTHGASPAVQRLAARIINAQRDEIESMQRWLRQRGQPVPTVRVEGLALVMGVEGEAGGMDHAAMDHGGMGHSGHDAGHDTAGHEGMDHEGMDHGAGHGGHVASAAGVRHEMAGMDHASMPGMLSQAQLEELDRARGPEFDRLFLRYMIQHHGGALTMVDDLLAVDGAAQDTEAFKLASDIHADQETEIARMELMLRQMTD